MIIRKTEVFTFDIPFMQGVVALSVPAETEQQAAKIIKEWMNKTQLELALQFPEITPINSLPLQAAEPTELGQLQIGLLEDLAKACNLDIETLSKSIKKATGLAMTLDNFKLIIPKLEAIRDGKQLPDEKEG